MLGSDPQFGSAEAIEVRNLARYRLGLRVLAGCHPRAADRLERLCGAADAELRPLMYDPVLRNAFEDDMTALENGADRSHGLVWYLERGIADSFDGLGPCERLARPRVRPWPDRGVSWVWTDLEPGSEPERVLARRLETLLAGTLSENGSGSRVTPDAGMLAGLGQGAALLAELLPHTGAGVLPHISLAGFVRDDEPGPSRTVRRAAGDRVRGRAHPRQSGGRRGWVHHRPGARHYLGRQAAQVYGEMLTPRGRRFVDWLLGAVAPIAPGILSERAPAVAAAVRSVKEVELDARGYRQAQPVRVCPTPAQGQLVALSPDPPRFRWLNDHAWLIYALCDGRDLPSLREGYRQVAGSGDADRLGSGVADLLSAGLIVPAGA